jgi:hypothetical protein
MTQPLPEPVTVPRASGQEIADASVGELFSHVTQDLSVLLRQELDLARAEVKQEVTAAGKAAGMLGGAGFAGYMVLLFVSIAAWWGLANVMDQGWAALIVAGIWAVAGAVLFTVGRDRMKRVNPAPELTVETVRELPDTLKRRVRN